MKIENNSPPVPQPIKVTITLESIQEVNFLRMLLGGTTGTMEKNAPFNLDGHFSFGVYAVLDDICAAAGLPEEPDVEICIGEAPTPYSGRLA